MKIKQYSKQFWAIKKNYKKKSNKMLITKPLPILKKITFNNVNYDFCCVEIHGKSIKKLYLWNCSMQNLMNERIVINWKGKEKIGLQKWDNYRIKYQSKIYQSSI